MTNRSLSLLLEFDSRAKRDEGQSPVFLHRRDRKFALTCEKQNIKPTPQRWIAHMNQLSGEGADTESSSKTLRFWSRINRGFATFGAVFGILTMIGLLFYDGGQRINITVIIAFVAFQLLLALFTTVQSLLGWQPWKALLQRFQKNMQQSVFSKLQPLLMAKAAHIGGLCFALSGLATLLVMVVLQDLAFGWSTTLNTSANSYYTLVSVLATPWSWAGAAPDFALVEATRFFRAGETQATINPNVWGQWWPFVAMFWLTYALVPRAILYVLTRFLLHRKANALLNQHASMHALLYRMETPSLDTGNESNDAKDLPNTNTALSVEALPNANIVLYWAGATSIDSLETSTETSPFVAKIGGRMSLAQDQTTLNELTQRLSQEKNAFVIIVTRSWEPPTGELEDFITKAEQQWPSKSRIFLVPVATDPKTAPNNQLIQQWLRFANRCSASFVSVSLLQNNKNDDDTSQDSTI